MVSEEDSPTEGRSPAERPENPPQRRVPSRVRESGTVDSQGSDDAIRVDRLCVLHEQAQRTIDRQLQWTRAIDTKAMRLLRFNVVTIGLLLTALSIAAKFGTGDSMQKMARGFARFVNVHTIIGGSALLLSTVVAGLAYTASELELGLGTGVLVQLQSHDYTSPEYHEELVGGYYPQWIYDNMEKLRWNANLITATVWLVIYGVLLLVVGVVHPLVEPVPGTASFVLTTAVVGSGAGISATDYL